MLDDDQSNIHLGSNSLRTTDCKIYEPSDCIILIYDTQEKVSH